MNNANYQISNEFNLWKGENFIIFNIVYLDLERNAVTVSITDTGKIILSEYETVHRLQCNFYFEYGYLYTKVYLNDFEEV